MDLPGIIGSRVFAFLCFFLLGFEGCLEQFRQADPGFLHKTGHRETVYGEFLEIDPGLDAAQL